MFHTKQFDVTLWNQMGTLLGLVLKYISAKYSKQILINKIWSLPLKYLAACFLSVLLVHTRKHNRSSRERAKSGKLHCTPTKLINEFFVLGTRLAFSCGAARALEPGHLHNEEVGAASAIEPSARADTNWFN
jgi:hypothetical protein